MLLFRLKKQTSKDVADTTFKVNIDQHLIILKNQLNHQLNTFNSKKFGTVQNILQNVLFSFTNLAQSNFLNCPKFFMITKGLTTALAPTEMKQNLLHWIFFHQDKGFLVVLSSY